MMRKILIALAASAASLGGCASMNDGATTAAAAGDLTPEQAMPYVTMAGASDLYEIQAGQLAQQRAQSADVRGFGQMLVQHHTQTTQQLMTAARAAGLNPPPPALTPMHRDMIRQLEQSSGAAFDRLFIDQQVRAHEMALNLHRNYAANGDAPALRTAAGAAVPIISDHLQRARGMNR